MGAPQNKAELLSAIHTSYRKLSEEIDRLPPEAILERSLEGHAKGSLMSPHDLLAYLLGWNELVLKWHDRKSRNEQVDFPETGFKWNQLGLLAQKFYRDYQELPSPLLRQRLDATCQRLAELIEGYDDEGLYSQPWYEKWTLGRMIQFNTASPYKNACGRLRQWRKAREAASSSKQEQPG